MTAVPMDSPAETLGGVIGQWAGRVIGGAIGELAGPEAVPLGVIVGGKVGQWAGAAAGAYLASKMTGANEKVEDKTKAQAQDEACSTCPPPKKDPCKGLRKQLEKHRKKLDEYIKDPKSMDNLSVLGKGMDELIITKRIDSLKRQIESFEKEVKKCEEQNGTS